MSLRCKEQLHSKPRQLHQASLRKMKPDYDDNGDNVDNDYYDDHYDHEDCDDDYIRHKCQEWTQLKKSFSKYDRRHWWLVSAQCG